MNASESKSCVLHVYDKLSVDGSTIHGGARLLMWTLPRLAAHGYEAQLVSLRERDSAGERLEAAGVKMHYLAKQKFNPAIVFDLVRLIRSERARVLHVHGYASSNFGRLAAFLTGIPVIIHEHFIDSEMPWYQQLADRILSQWTTVGIGVSKAVSQSMKQRRHMPANRVLTLTSGVPFEDFRRRQEDELVALRREFQIDPSQMVVGCIGRLATVKGHNILIKGWSKIIAACPKAVLLIVGDGPERASLERLVQECGVQGSVKLVGHRDDVADCLSLFQLFCMPSFSEGFPMALIEAMAVRIPIVASNVGGIAELLTSEKDALLVPSGDSGLLAAAVVRVLSDSALADRLVVEATRTADSLNIDAFVSSLAHLYDKFSTLPRARARADWTGFNWAAEQVADKVARNPHERAAA